MEHECGAIQCKDVAGVHTQQTILGIAGRFWYNWLSLLLRHLPVDIKQKELQSTAKDTIRSRDENSQTPDIPSQDKISKGGEIKSTLYEVRQNRKI